MIIRNPVCSRGGYDKTTSNWIFSSLFVWEWGLITHVSNNAQHHPVFGLMVQEMRPKGVGIEYPIMDY